MYVSGMNDDPTFGPQRAADARARAEKALALNESLLWCGKPVATFFYPGWWKTFLAGLVWCAMMWTLLPGFLLPAWRQYLAGDGAKSLGILLGETAFAVPFIAIGIFLLLMPLWAMLARNRQVYAVTNQRAMVIGTFSTTSWRAMEMKNISRTDWPNGRTDIYFALQSTGSDTPPRPAGFESLRTTDASAAIAALERLARPT